MALFGNDHNSSPHRDEYAAVADDETKELRVGGDGSEHDHEPAGSHQELFVLKKSLRRANLFLKIIIGMLVLCLFALLSINVPESVRSMVKDAKCGKDSLIKTPVPDLGNVKVTFDKHPVYSQRPNDVSDAAWNKLLPPGRGFVYIKDWKKYDLPPGQDTQWGEIYSTAVFHQMHCLGQIRRFSWMFLDAISQNNTASQEEITQMFVHNDHAEHMNHCFDYLRQTIQCGGDMAMEWPRTEPDGQRIAVDGWGIPHECKDWSKIMDYMDKEHFDHSWNEDIAPLIPDVSGQVQN